MTITKNKTRLYAGRSVHQKFIVVFWFNFQTINFWRVLVLNDEHTERKYVMFFFIGWGRCCIYSLDQTKFLHCPKERKTRDLNFRSPCSSCGGILRCGLRCVRVWNRYSLRQNILGRQRLQGYVSAEATDQQISANNSGCCDSFPW